MKDAAKDAEQYRYEVLESWTKIPRDWVVDEVAGVDVDSKDRLYVFSRGDHPVMVFDRDGSLLDSWGADIFTSAHSIRVGPDDSIYCVDYGDHTVRGFAKDGTLKLTLGTKNGPSATGAVGRDCRTIRQAAGPFNYPTDIAFGPNGDFFVSDGYGNARVHRFSKDGALLASFGEPGTGPGQFRLPHGVCVSGDRLYVADRENSRVQVFDLEGRYISEWDDVRRPTSIRADGKGTLFVSELGYKKETKPLGGDTRSGTNPASRVTLRSGNGSILSEIGGGDDGCAAGSFFAPHMLCTDSRGDLYVGEVVFATNAPKGCHTLQKFLKK